MRVATILAGCFFAVFGTAYAAQPESFVYPKFTSPKLGPGEGFQGIPGVKNLKVVFDHLGSLQKNECPAITNIPIYAFTDGIDTLASLEGTGFVVTDFKSSLCTGATGKITEWAFTMVLTNGVFPNETTYQLTAVSGKMYGPTTTFVLLTYRSDSGETVYYDASNDVGKWSIASKPN